MARLKVYSADSREDGQEKTYFTELCRRFYLSYDMIVEAKAVFDRYRLLDETQNFGTIFTSSQVPPSGSLHLSSDHTSSEQQQESVAAAKNTGTPQHSEMVEHLSHSAVEGVTVSPIPEGSRDDTPHSEPTLLEVLGTDTGMEVLGLQGLQAFFLDLGIAKSALEIADLIQQMCGCPPELQLLRQRIATDKAERQRVELGGGSISRNLSIRSTTTSQTTKTTVHIPTRVVNTHSTPVYPLSMKGGEADSNPSILSQDVASLPPRGLTFPAFLYLLQQRLHDEEDTNTYKDMEVRDLFEFLDHDRDGSVSVGDLATVLQRVRCTEEALASDEAVMKLVAMHPVELRAALDECDSDADGRVTLVDLQAVLRV